MFLFLIHKTKLCVLDDDEGLVIGFDNNLSMPTLKLLLMQWEMEAIGFGVDALSCSAYLRQIIII